MGLNSPVNVLMIACPSPLLKIGFAIPRRSITFENICFPMKPEEGCSIPVSVLFCHFVLFTSELCFSSVKLKQAVGYVSSAGIYLFFVMIILDVI